MTFFKQYGLSASLLALLHSSPLHAAPNEVDVTGLLPTEFVQSLFEQDPAVAAARAGLGVSEQDSKLVIRSPYEWTATFSSQKRKMNVGGGDYQEWSASLERPLRLPTKIGVDKRIGQAILDQGDAQYGEAVHETARLLLTLWLDWLQAKQGTVLVALHQQAAQKNMELVATRLQAGDASQLDLGLAQGEAAEQQRAENDGKLAEALAWAKLHARFPSMTKEFSVLPSVRPLTLEANFLRQRITDQSDELKIAKTAWQEAQSVGDRMRADRVPDPTVGIFSASEFGGAERVVGISVSIPIPGSQRSAHAARAVQASEMTRQEFELVRREVESTVANGLVNTEGTYASWESAETGAAAMQNNSVLMQRAYALGEADLQSLLSARRLATAASQTALVAKVSAVRAYYSILIDAHLVWGLEHQ